MADSLGMILLPLFLMGLIGFVGAVLPASVIGGIGYEGSFVPSVYYDVGGHAVCYVNGSAVSGGEAGYVDSNMKGFPYIGGYQPVAAWFNDTVLSRYKLYYDAVGRQEVPLDKYLIYKDSYDSGSVSGGRVWYGTGDGADTGDPASQAFFNAMVGGLTASVVGVIAFIVLVGLNIVSSGLNDTATRQLVGISLFSALWIIVSAFGVSLLTAVPVVGWVVYLVLVFSYFLGVYGMINGGGTF